MSCSRPISRTALLSGHCKWQGSSLREVGLQMANRRKQDRQWRYTASFDLAKGVDRCRATFINSLQSLAIHRISCNEELGLKKPTAGIHVVSPIASKAVSCFTAITNFLVSQYCLDELPQAITQRKGFHGITKTEDAYIEGDLKGRPPLCASSPFFFRAHRCIASLVSTAQACVWNAGLVLRGKVGGVILPAPLLEQGFIERLAASCSLTIPLSRRRPSFEFNLSWGF